MLTFPKTIRKYRMKPVTVGGLTLTQHDYPGKGSVLEFVEARVVHCCYTGLPIRRNAHYVILKDREGWRIDLLPPINGMPTEAVNGVGDDHPSHWATPDEAVEALRGVLVEIETKTHI